MSRRWSVSGRMVAALLLSVALAGAGFMASADTVLGQTPPPEGTQAQRQVQVVNGTPDGGSVSGIPVTAFVVEGESMRPLATGETDERGIFALSAAQGSAGSIEAQYIFSTTYAGAPYLTQPLTSSVLSATLQVFEATGDDTAVSIANAGLVIVEVDAPTQIIRVLESVTLSNSGDRTFVPSTAGPRGPMGLLRFGLPQGAGNFTPDPRLSQYTVIQVDTGFATDMPLPPGDTELTFAYELAYGALSESGYAQLTKNLPYPVDLLNVLAVDGEFTVESGQLRDAGVADIGGRTYRQYTAENLPARDELTLDLRGLPLVLPALRPGNPWLQAMLLILLLAALVAPFLYARWYRKQVASAARTAPAMAGAPGAIRTGATAGAATYESVSMVVPARVRRVDRGRQSTAEGESSG